MSKHYTMKSPRIEVEFRTLEEATAKGGVFAINLNSAVGPAYLS